MAARSPRVLTPTSSWSAFERAVSARSYGGLGLGLYIARQIVDAHGGHVSVVSDLGAGTLVRVELPYAVVAD